MLGAGLQFNRSRSEDRFYNPAKARRNYHQNQNQNQLKNQLQNDVVNGVSDCKEKKPVDRSEETPKPAGLTPVEQFEASLTFSNIERFLDAITPSVHAHYLSKTTMRGWSTCDVEFQPYFMLSDLWESFREWSAYGAGVPLVLNGSDSVAQYYVPYLSAIQIYVGASKSPTKSRRTTEDSDSDYFSKDSSSDGSSDSERDRGLTYSRRERQHTTIQEEFSSDEGEFRNPQSSLLLEYLEHDPPYGRGPLADKVSDLATRFPELKTLCSCDLLPASWLSVAWYPIYRIPTGPTLKDLDACFLTYHSLYTPVGDISAAEAPVALYPDEIDGIPRISLPVFGLASYKFRGSVWTSSSGSDHHLVNSLSLAADNWLGVLQVNHPDYLFFCRSR